MSANSQTFNGRVEGDVAGGNLTVNHFSAAHERPESELQAVFKRHTGIHCGREVREHLERLMSDHGFTAQELGRAWNIGSLVWDRQAKQLKAGSRKLDIAAGWVGVVTTTSVLIIALAKIMLEVSSLIARPSLLLAITIAYLFTTRYILLATIFPQATARRAEKTFGG